MREEACDWERRCEDKLQRHYCLTHCSHYSCADQCATHNVTTIHEDGAWELARSTPGYDMYCLLISQALGVRQYLHFLQMGTTMQDISCLGGYLSVCTILRTDTSTTISAVLGDVYQNYLVPGLGLPKFGPEPQFEPRTPKPNLRLRIGQVQFSLLGAGLVHSSGLGT